MPIDLWLDFLSPYSYLAWKRRSLLPSPVRARPVVLAAILSHFGQLGPAEIPPKRVFTIRDTLRRAAEAGVPLVWPERHPFKPILAARVAYAADTDPLVVDALFDAAWGRGENLEDPDVVAAAVASLDPSLVERAKSQSDRLRTETSAAIARGVFGVPTFDVDGELFFGDDQIPRIVRKLAGEDPLDVAVADLVAARPPGVVRGAARVDLDPGRGSNVVAIFDRTPFMASLGARLVRVGEGVAESMLEVRPDLRQQDGFAHAGVQAALADHTAGACAATVAGPNSRVLSVTFDVHLLRPARGTHLFCRATILRGGRRISVVESTVHDGADASAPISSKATVTLAVSPGA
jgi:uncharacterized protein (TIGR00369 family)